MPVAISSDGRLVPHDSSPAPVPPEWGSTNEHGGAIGPYGTAMRPGDGTPAASPDAANIRPRVPVLGADGAPTHLIEPGPRLVQPDSTGRPQYVQQRFPVPADHPRMRDIPISSDAPPAGQMPAPDNYASSNIAVPIDGPAGSVRLDADGVRPRPFAATLWDDLGVPPGGRIEGVGTINADGVITTTSGDVVAGDLVRWNKRTETWDLIGRVDGSGSIRGLDGGEPDMMGARFVPQVTTRDGRVVGYTTVDGRRVER